MYTHQFDLQTKGCSLETARTALILIHGRGGTAADILGLAGAFGAADRAFLAPQASNRSWYPYSFMAPVEDNQPALDSALSMVAKTVEQATSKGLALNQIYFAGFSQGACLCLEYVARNAARYGGIIAFTGGLIGKQLIAGNYQGDFEQTPLLLSTGDPDPHVPLSRVEESASVLQNLHASVHKAVYAGRPHTISREEISLASKLVFGAP